MNIGSFSNLSLISSVSFLKERIVLALTPQQKKIALVVSVALGFLAAAYLAFRHFDAKAKKAQKSKEAEFTAIRAEEKGSAKGAPVPGEEKTLPVDWSKPPYATVVAGTKN